jgi:hypothetical protein
MPFTTDKTVTLTCHPETRGDAIRSISAHVGRTADGMLSVTYSLQGALARVRVPAERSPRITERLWQHTCCEIFVARKSVTEYHEFNFSPSSEWATYAFASYRDGGLLADEALNPHITARCAAERLDLAARLSLARLSPLHVGAKLAIALAAVVEDDTGALSYWALRHPSKKPDFHHPDSFALELDEVRR